jgi:hypothetical protein
VGSFFKIINPISAHVMGMFRLSILESVVFLLIKLILLCVFKVCNTMHIDNKRVIIVRQINAPIS